MAIDPKEFSSGDWLQAVGIITSLIASIVAIVISVLTLRQSAKMIEDEGRPYITMYHQTTNFQNLATYFVIKNFGKTSAMVTEFSCSIDVDKLGIDSRQKIFSHILNTTFAPGQSKSFRFNHMNITGNDWRPEFTIKYSSGKKAYTEIVTLNLEIEKDSPVMRASTDDKELKIISYALQELVEKNL